MKCQSLFDEVDSIKDTVLSDAEKYYETLLVLQNENYNFTEVKNKGFFETRHKNFFDRLQKFQVRQQHLLENYMHFQKAFESGQFINSHFIKLNVDELYKVPEQIKLPRWFEYFKEEEFEKVKAQLNDYASRLYRSKITESLKSDRKKIQKKINHLIEDISERYLDDANSLPLIKINELQHCNTDPLIMIDIEELQGYDRVIPEICYEVMHKAADYARAVVSAFIEFRQKSSDYIQSIV